MKCDKDIAKNQKKRLKFDNQISAVISSALTLEITKGNNRLIQTNFLVYAALHNS